MLEKYFSAPKTLARLRSGPSGPYIDGFAGALERDSYSPLTAVRYLRAAAHFGRFLRRRSGSPAEIDASTLDAFYRHLSRCHCPSANNGKDKYHTRFGAKRFHSYLVRTGISQPSRSSDAERSEPELIVSFRDWFRQHRGVTEPTLRQYARGAAALIDGLGADPTCWKALQVREFMLDRSRHCGAETTQKLITSLRAFLRYLRFRGLCSADLDQAVPAFAHWRLARMPRCLSAEEVKRLIASCKGSTPRRLRDRAIILMLVRLGLRAGDVSQLRLSDIEWQCGTLRVVGKGHLLPFDSLVDDKGEYLIASRIVTVAPSASVLYLIRTSTPVSQPSLTFLGVGDVQFQQGPLMAERTSGDSNAPNNIFDLAGDPLPNLPKTRDEIMEAAGIFGQKSVELLGADATEAAFKAEPLDQFRIIHIATHAIASATFPDRSALVLGEDSKKQEDGLLQAREIRRLHLNADLVTLSACDTGAGRLRGEEGIASLERSFLFAGARSVLATLWTASDAYTRSLVEHFYRHLAAGEDKGAALREAKLDLIKEFRSEAVPYYWAGFYLIGDASGPIPSLGR